MHGHDRIQRFQSTLSMRRATRGQCGRFENRFISIHALHEESDFIYIEDTNTGEFQSTLSMRRATVATTCTATIAYKDFNPRSP